METAVRRNRAQRGFSYLEATFAIAIVAICLVPGMRLIPALLASQRAPEGKYLLTLIAQQKLEAAILALEEDFRAGQEDGDLAAEGHPDWHYDLVVTVPSEGDGRYAVLRVRAWDDENGNDGLDEGETSVRFDTKQSNLNWSP